MRMPFGRHLGARIEDLPNSYLKWAYEDLHIQSDRVWEQIRREYARRWGRKKAERFRARHNDQQGYHGPQPHTQQRQQRKQSQQQKQNPEPRAAGSRAQEIADSQPHLFAELIHAGYRALAKRYHPDLNPGDAAAAEKMRLLNLLIERL
jgi:hypothetical protein